MTNESIEGADAVALTEPATRFIERMLRLSGLGPSAAFRLLVTPGGCSGPTASFRIEPRPELTDRALRFGPLTIYVPSTTRPLLEGVTIDFVDTPTHTGFELLDPNRDACGCATGDTAVQLTRLT